MSVDYFQIKPNILSYKRSYEITFYKRPHNHHYYDFCSTNICHISSYMLLHLSFVDKYTVNKTVLINEFNLKWKSLGNKCVVQGSLETVFMIGEWSKYFMGAADSTSADTMQSTLYAILCALDI